MFHTETHYALPALTAENRGVWAELRQKLLQNPVNARNLDIVESCVCVLVLSDDGMSLISLLDTKMSLFT